MIDRITWLAYALLAVIVFLLLAGVIVQAKAEELSEISPRSAAYCALYSREATFIEVMHPTRSITADTDIILDVAKGHYAQCLAILPTLLPLPKELGSLETWLADIRDILILKAGTKPAADDPEPAEEPSSSTLSDEEWRAQCRAEYRTWNEDTGTVIRGNGIGEVRCPCGTEVVCGE